MKFFSRCEACKKYVIMIKKRKYSTHHAGIITSQKLICNECANNTKKMLGEELK